MASSWPVYCMWEQWRFWPGDALAHSWLNLRCRHIGLALFCMLRLDRSSLFLGLVRISIEPSLLATRLSYFKPRLRSCMADIMILLIHRSVHVRPTFWYFIIQTCSPHLMTNISCCLPYKYRGSHTRDRTMLRFGWNSQRRQSPFRVCLFLVHHPLDRH